ncbi:hypothetical protein DH2020_019241 [Rehmannia glutinosa]|uniref:RNase H type-1 domain-containing protein n=1 Tax=Rehmannia glutinosa TaxID=99300 RepID=A0ABR0WMK7_REHGL
MEKAPPPCLKLNTDGAFHNQYVIAGIGGVLKDDKGEVLWAYTVALPLCLSAFHAESSALERALILLSTWNMQQLWIETDSLILCNTISKAAQGNWSIKDVIVNIHNSLRNISFHITHVYKEGNKVVDDLASLGTNSVCLIEFASDSLPLFVKGLVRVDQLDIPSFRIMRLYK